MILLRNVTEEPVLVWLRPISKQQCQVPEKHPSSMNLLKTTYLFLKVLLAAKFMMDKCEKVLQLCFSAYKLAGSWFSNFGASILHMGMFSFLLRSFKDGWTSTSRINTLSSISRLLTSTSILGGMCSAGQRYFRLALILLRWPPVSA